MKRILFGLPVFLLAACGNTDPYSRPDTWSASDSNAKNLAAMVANPQDLVLGRGNSGRVEARPSTGAVERISEDRPKPLLDATKSGGGGGGGGGGS